MTLVKPAISYVSGFVGLLGPANAGKSTLLNVLVGKKVSIVSSKAQSTRQRLLGIKNCEEGQIVFVDTPGFLAKRHRGELSRFIRGNLAQAAQEVDILTLVVDGARALKEEMHLEQTLGALRQHASGLPQVVIINKVDLFPYPQLLPLIDRISRAIGDEAPGNVAEVVPLSAKSREGVERLTEVLLRLLPEGAPLYPTDEFSDQPEEFFVAEVIREKLFVRLREELPYSLAVVVQEWEDRGKSIKIGAEIIVERDSQKGIVIGSQGTMLKQVGIAAREQLERMYGVKVFLELQVKVEEGWTRSKAGLMRAGYDQRTRYGVLNPA